VEGSDQPSHDAKLERVRHLALVAGLAEAQRLIARRLDDQVAEAHDHGVSLRELARVIETSPETVRRRIKAVRNPSAFRKGALARRQSVEA
jgi:hypothetical protein